jgi:Zn-dependent M28 family amino/carboxypeptidase
MNHARVVADGGYLDPASCLLCPQLRGHGLVRNLSRVSLAPRGREPGHASFLETARWAAKRLQQHGVEPLFPDRKSENRYLQHFEWTYSRAHVSANVVGIRRGRQCNSEAIVVVAHLDGLSARVKGKEGITDYQGANDNASGVSALLSVSEQLARYERRYGKLLDRDVVFLLSSAEEEGNVGSEAFARFAKGQLADKKIVGVLNLDMVGQYETTDKGARGLALYAGQNDDQARANPLYAIAERVAAGKKKRADGIGIIMDGHRLHRHAYRASDQAIFVGGGVHSVMVMGRVIEQMHTSADRIEKVDVSAVKHAARFAARLVRELAHRDTRLPEGKTLPLDLSGIVGWGPLRPRDDAQHALEDRR